MGFFLQTFFALLAIAIGAAYFASRRYRTTRPPKNKKSAFTKTTKDDVTLSIVVPCYNEEERLPPMLSDAISFCDSMVAKPKAQRVFDDYEIIVVDDSSRDKTVAVAEKFAAANPSCKLKVVRVVPNHGKGHAVRTGFFESSGDFVLMADGDNATQIADVEKLLVRLLPTAKATSPTSPKTRSGAVDAQPLIAAGSRAHLEQLSIAERTLSRTILMRAFHLVVAVAYFVCTRGAVCHIRDTQCGFKLFKRKETEVLFLNNRLERWAFDVEIFILAQRCGMGIVEVPVRWQEIPGSKVRFGGMAQMGLECALMCFTYTFGFWSILMT